VTCSPPSYAQRMFFLVTLPVRAVPQFEGIPLMIARHYAEQNLARARRGWQRPPPPLGASFRPDLSF